ncbi:hypothetical protein RJ45_21920 [Photobacterium gaetbulicola]|uniref:Uncharacterized protein n=2 Tax=Photobacterium gaetbulicola TaxID=1295392 RepID=A0A0B9FZC9_9GAMM|nr:hypothetical protein RJ45_21920 [Photobacterium gaetbulicola]
MVIGQNILIPLSMVVFILASSLLKVDLNLEMAVTSYVCAVIIALAFSYLVTKRLFKEKEESAREYIDIKTEPKANLDFLSVSIMTIMQSHGVLFIIGSSIDVKEYAYISTALKLANVITFIYVSILILFKPSFSRLFHEEKHDHLKSTVKKATKSILACTVIIIVSLFLFSKDILALYGNEFIQAEPYLKILLIAYVINCIAIVPMNVLLMTGYQKDVKNTFIFSLILSLILAFLLPKFFSSIGAAIALVISLSLQNAISFIIFKKKFGYYSF